MFSPRLHSFLILITQLDNLEARSTQTNIENDALGFIEFVIRMDGRSNNNAPCTAYVKIDC